MALIDRKLLKNFDWNFFIMILIICGIGILIVYSSTSTSYEGQNFFKTPYGKQLVWMIFGCLTLITVSLIDYHVYAKLSYFLYLMLVLLLTGVLLFGVTNYGAKRWIDLGFMNFQPSEFAKIIVILIMSRYFATKRDMNLKLIDMIFSAIVVGIPFILILKEPDLGTAILLMPIFVFYIFMCKENLKYFIVLILIGAICTVILWFNLKDYQRLRITTFLNPEYDKLGAGYQIAQSKIAVGSGGIFGKGFKAGTQAQLDFLPAQHTDFIFSVLAEEFGFMGASTLVLLFFFMILRGINICTKAKDNIGIFMGSGILLIFTMNIAINIFMVLGLFPVTGVTLPLVSYGGSSIITTMAYLGIIESINIHRFLF
jgi:rod shape determining protein RodA